MFTANLLILELGEDLAYFMSGKKIASFVVINGVISPLIREIKCPLI